MAGRYSRGTGWVTPFEVEPAQTRWIWAGWRRGSARHDGRGLLSGRCGSGMGGRGEGLRRGRGDAAGVKPGAGPADRSAVNVGTARAGSVPFLPARGAGRVGAMPAEGRGRGGAAVVLRGRESRPHGEGRQRVSSGRRL